ncbi:unnamed protein product, partial [Prorocentrum cordatum]
TKAGETFCTFALSVPKVKPIRDTNETSSRVRFRNATIRVIDYMMKNPQQTPELRGQIESGLVGKTATKNGSGSGSADTPDNIDLTWAGTSVGKVHPKVKAAQLAALPDGPSEALLDLIDDNDARAIKGLFAFAFQYKSSDIFTDEMGDMSTWALMNVRRNAQIGIDFGFWIKDCVNPDTGVIDWGRRPLYTPIWGKEYLASVRVINGDTASPPKGVFITYEYKLDNPFCAEGAGWVLDTARYPCKDWFSVQHGPNKYRIDKKGNMLIDLCTGAAAEITARQQQVMALTNGPSLVSLDTREKRRREEALQKARKRLATKSSESIRMLSYDKKDGTPS